MHTLNKFVLNKMVERLSNREHTCYKVFLFCKIKVAVRLCISLRKVRAV